MRRKYAGGWSSPAYWRRGRSIITAPAVVYSLGTRLNSSLGLFQEGNFPRVQVVNPSDDLDLAR